MLSLLLGCIFVISALTGRMMLIGPENSRWLLYIGLGLVAFGSFRLAAPKRRSDHEPASCRSPQPTQPHV